MDYKQAGVDIEEGYRAVAQYREWAASTSNSAVIDGIGSFGGMFSLKGFINAADGMADPVLIAGTDGVGTKLDIAFRLKKYDTVGIDCVAMCVNDILCQGARPLFFLDYLACGKLDADIAAELVKGVAAGCRETSTVLLGGETAEHPGLMPDNLYDLAFFFNGTATTAIYTRIHTLSLRDALLGIASSGVHSNGFSLIRKVITHLDEDFGGMPIGRVLLEPTRLYVKPILELMNQVEIRGMAHITGGGFYENIPRIFSRGTPLCAVVHDPLKDGYDGGWKVPPIFHRIAYGIKTAGAAALTGSAAQNAGEEILRTDPDTKKLMFNTYNMGIGFVLALAPGDVQKAAAFLEDKGFPAWKIGRVEKAQGPSEGLRFV
jgi:phosphoribosylformylglycinamidine cyclo-ligase